MTTRGESPSAEPLLTPEEVCAWLRIGRRHLYRLVERGDVPHLKIGNRLRFERGEIGR